MKMIRNLAFAALCALALLAGQQAKAATSSQVTHAYLCMPESVIGGANRRVTVPTTNGGTYQLNGQGCALVVGADVGWFLTQGATYGQGLFTLRAEGISSSSTTAVSTNLTLPAYGYIVGLVLCETAGNAVTGGLNIGDAGSATRFASAVALAANACVVVADSALTRIVSLSGVPTAETILLAAATSWNSALVNITVLYAYW